MLVAVEYVVSGNSARQTEIYTPSTLPDSVREVRRTVAEIRWGRKWWLYVRAVKVLSIEFMALPLPQATW